VVAAALRRALAPRAADHSAAARGAINPASSLRGEFTRRLTGQASSRASG
jgi:hypothetical protein